MAQASGIGCFPTSEEKIDSVKKDAEKEKHRLLLRRSFLKEKTQAWEELEKKKRKEIQETQGNEIKRPPYQSFIFEKKPDFMEVFYIDLTRKDKKTKTLLLEDLPLRWQMPAPQAVLSITGIDHQFDIKDKYSLKRDLIDAVISTGSWVVTCGTELGVVRFIEEAINAHVAMKKLHIPIVGILSKRVNKEMIKEQKPKETISIKKRNETNWNTIPCYSTNEVLDPIHTQFIFTDDPNGNPIGSDEACREAYEHFLSTINTKEPALYEPVVGESVILAVEVNSVNVTGVKWFKNKLELNIASNDRLSDELYPSLKIRNVLLTDAGNYVCSITDGVVTRNTSPIILAPKEFNTVENNDTSTTTVHESNIKPVKPNELLPVVLVLIEGGIDSLETTWSVLMNNNHVVIIDGSGGAANVLSACYRLVTTSNASFKRDSNHGSTTLSESKTKNRKDIKELIDEYFEEESEELRNKATETATNCFLNINLIHIYTLDKKTTKVTQFIQDAIFNSYKEYYETVRNQGRLTNKNELKTNEIKKTLKLVEKWKRCDIAVKDVFIAKNRKQLSFLQSIDKKRMSKLPPMIKSVVDDVQKRYEQHSGNFSKSYEEFKKNAEQFKNDNNKKKYFLALKYSFNELVEHVDYMPIADQGRLKLQLNGLREEFNNVHKKNNTSVRLAGNTDHDESVEIITKLQENIKLFMRAFDQMYVRIDIGLSESYEKFKKSVLQFERVNKKPYFLTLKESFDKLLKQMSVDDYKKSKFKMKFKEIEIEFDDMEIVNEKEMVELENEIHKEMTKGANKFLIFLYNQFKDDVSQLKEANKANYCMDKNKVKYFTNVSTSLTKVMESMEVEFGKDKEEKTFRMTIQELVDENEKDGVSELFQSTLIANRTDFVILMLDKIEHMSAFVLGYLPNVFRLCIDTDDDAVIQLIDQHWKHFCKIEVESEKIQLERKKQLHKRNEITAREEIYSIQTELEENENVLEIDRTRAQLREISARLKIKKDKRNNRILLAVNNFIIDLFEDTEFKLYDVKESEEIELIYKDKPFHHLFVWAVLVNSREMAMIFWELETDHTCAALFASAVLNELAEKALFSKHMHHSASLKENAGHFETLACNLMTELYSIDRESALKTLVTKVGRFNSTPLKIAVSQKLKKFMAHTACQAQLNIIWSGDIAVYTSAWKIAMVILFPILLIQRLGFIIIKPKTRQISPGQNEAPKPDHKRNSKPGQTRETGQSNLKDMLYSAYRFYCAPVTKFVVYMIAYMIFVIIFAIFVLTDLYPLSERPPSIFEYLTWVWTLSLAIEEIRQILQTNKGSLPKNLKFWAKDFWNIFDMSMYLLFLLSVVLRCLLNSDQFYYARMSYAVTLSMFILRSMHFFFIQRYIGPKVVMIGRMLGDLGFFIALYALFLFSFGIMYQAIMFPNSVSSPWELLKDLVYLPYWQLYGELNLEQIEGTEPSKCTKDPQLYTNGTMDRCPEKNQFNMIMPAVYLILTNILLVNIIIAIFSQTFQNVQNNSEMIYKFHRYALVYEYHDRPMFPIPIVIHLWRIILFWYDKKRRPTKYGGAFVIDAKPKEIEKLHIREKTAYETLQNGPYYTRNKYDAMKMMTDERDILKEIDSTPTQQDIKDLRIEMQGMRESLIQEIRNLENRLPAVVLDSRQ